MQKLFESDLQIPDLCPRPLILPDSPEYLWLSKPSQDGDVSPIELSWHLFDAERSSRLNLARLRILLENALMEGPEKILEVHQDIAVCDFSHHQERTIARIALDPRRYATFNIRRTYAKDRATGLHADDLMEYFREFSDNYGIVRRTVT